jgi:hypothetical protein
VRAFSTTAALSRRKRLLLFFVVVVVVVVVVVFSDFQSRDAFSSARRRLIDGALDNISQSRSARARSRCRVLLSSLPPCLPLRRRRRRLKHGIDPSHARVDSLGIGPRQREQKFFTMPTSIRIKLRKSLDVTYGF